METVRVRVLRFGPFFPPESYSLEELTRRLNIIKSQGYLPILGKERNAAVGESLEFYLGLRKSSSKEADWGDYELKTMSSNKIGLFSIAWRYHGDYNPRWLISKFGKPHFSRHLQTPVLRLDWAIPHSDAPLEELHYNLPSDDAQMYLRHKTEIIATYEQAELRNRFSQKFKKLVVLKVQTEKRDKISHFQIINASLMENASFQRFIDGLRSNLIKINFAMMLINPQDSNPKFNTREILIQAPFKEIVKIYDSKIELL